VYILAFSFIVQGLQTTTTTTKITISKNNKKIKTTKHIFSSL
jgi:hypothetical protein